MKMKEFYMFISIPYSMPQEDLCVVIAVHNMDNKVTNKVTNSSKWELLEINVYIQDQNSQVV